MALDHNTSASHQQYDKEGEEMRLPPFGRDVQSSPGNVFVYAGRDAWTAGRRRAATVGKNSVLVLPPGEGFHSYRWPVQGLSLVLVWPDGSLSDVQAFGEHLVRSGAALVVAPHVQDPENALFIKSQRMAA
jgi:hypothetical protein